MALFDVLVLFRLSQIAADATGTVGDIFMWFGCAQPLGWSSYQSGAERVVFDSHRQQISSACIADWMLQNGLLR